MNAFIERNVTVPAGGVFVFEGLNYNSKSCWGCNGGWLFAPKATGQFTLTKAGVYRIEFTATVVSDAAGAVEINLNENGAVIPGTRMGTVVGTAGDSANVATVAEIVVPQGGTGYITITNAGANEITVRNASLIIDRIA